MMEQRLELVKELPDRTRDNHRLGLWKCSCGREKVIALSRVKNGYTKSCGCLSVDTSRRVNTTHGMKGTREYSSWQAMIGRCTSETHKDYPRYGAKGITVYDEWKNSFEAFFSHVGLRPKGKTLDRINPYKGYEPGNVRWATPLEQARNRKDLVIVETPEGVIPLVDYAKRIGITRGAAHLRLKRGKLEGVKRV